MVRIVFLAVALVAQTPSIAQSGITLAEVERLALEGSTALQRQGAAVRAAQARAARASKLPDPEAFFGAQNVPVDSLRLDAEDMTMLAGGIRQRFPPGDSRALRGDQARFMIDREEALAEAERRKVLRDVRRSFSMLCATIETTRLKGLLAQVRQEELRAAEQRYRNTAASATDALMARESLARLEAEQPEIEAERHHQLSELERIIGPGARGLDPVCPAALPPAPPAFDAGQHPEMRAANALAEAAARGLLLAHEERKPGWMVEAGYGARFDRPDLVSAQITIDLPWLARSSHDYHIAEEDASADGARADAADTRRDLINRHQRTRAQVRALGDRLWILDRRILPSAQEALAHPQAIGQDQAARRSIRERILESQIERARLVAELAAVQAELLYLTDVTRPEVSP